ncbi:uncharacterized protein LOC129407392 [Boleophthalmus pectinirostris]|uniref:uncharacterized protein LOC129407392 n=1 Tax=Boleophthalmus pectinirostris TaxID=150288 RepID=UPI0024332A53|nr:uncharacterized protein LOC129407392 [Boleophthalmus pectinirostris]
MEAACLKLTNRLNLKLSCESRHPGLQQPGTLSFDLSMDQTSFGCRASSNTFDHIDQSISPESNYKLQNITDIYDTARIQEACLRQENFYTFRCHKSPWTLPLCSDTTTNNITHRNRTEASSCTASVPMNQSARMITENCLSPKVTRLHEYKMLKRAQNQGASSRSSSPMHTSLRSLQAVRSSRSLDIDDYNLDQILHIRAGASSARTDSSYRSVSHSAHHMKPAQPTAIKRCQRSHSLSPCRIPHSSISSVERVFAPLKNRGAAWFQNGRQVQR